MPKKILLVEDEVVIAMSETQMLKKHGYQVITVNSGEKAVEAVDSDPDISLILMDIDLGKGIDGTEAAERILASHDLPIAFLSSHIEPEVVKKTEGISSYGYIVKNSGETVLIASVKMALRLYEAHMELKEQKRNLNDALIKYEQTAEELYEREGMFRNLMENSIDAVHLLDEEGRFLDINNTACAMTGYTRKELLSMGIADIDPNYPADAFYRFWKEKPKGTSLLFETIHKHKNGKLIPVEVNGIFFDVHKKKYLFGLARDLTGRKRAEERLRESEATVRKRLEAILESDGDIGALKLDDIIDSEALQTMMEDFYNLTGIGGAILDISGKILVGVAWQDICSKFHRAHPVTLKNCQESDINLTGKVPVGTCKAYHCKNNMWDIATPIEVGGIHLGNIYIGQFFYEDEVPDYELFRKQARQYGFDEAEYLAALDRVPRFSREKVHRAMTFYSRLANMISSLSYTTIMLSRNMVQQKNVEEKIKRQNEELVALNRNLEIFLNQTSDFIYFKDINSRFIFCSQTLADITGNKHWKEMIGKHDTEVFPRDLAAIYTKEEEPVFKEGKPLLNKVNPYYRVNGETGYVQTNKWPVLDEENSVIGIFGISRDITGLKQAQEKERESEKKYAEAFDLISGILESSQEVVIFALNTEYRYLAFNANHKKTMKDIWNAEIKVGSNMLDYITDPVDREKVNNNFDRALKGESFTSIEQYGDSSIHRRWYKNIYNPLYDSEGTIIGLTLFLSDITEFKENESALRQAIHQKDFLMKELNHRVKNSLLMVSSLISLKDAETDIDLSDIQHQIEAIGLIHEKLYQSDNETAINCRDYFGDLLSSIFSSFTARKVSIKKEIEDIYVSTKTAMSLGLLVNEIATNAIKHGFNEKEEALFSIKMEKNRQDSSWFDLSLSNTGNPFPGEIQIDNPATLGLRLITALVAQIDGTMELRKEPHPVFTFRFPLGEE